MAPARSEDLTYDPRDADIEFTPINSVDSPDAALVSVSLIPHGYLLRNVDSLAFDSAKKLVIHGLVHISSVSGTRASGTCSGASEAAMSVEISNGILVSNCDCQSASNSSPTIIAHAIPCEHVAALLLQLSSTTAAASESLLTMPLLCPVTREQIRGEVYICTKCQMCYSAAGWEFLHKMDRGRCCGCHNRNTIVRGKGGTPPA